MRIPIEDLYILGIDKDICEYCLKDMLDNDDNNGIIISDEQSGCSSDIGWQVQEEVIRWMTEGTDPHMSPRSDCG